MLAGSFLDPGPFAILPGALLTEYQRGFHDMVMLFQLMVEHDHETFWLFQFFLQKTVRTKPGSNLLLPTSHQAQGTDSLRHFLQPPNIL